MKLILEGARSHEPQGDVYATTVIRTDDREQPMDGRRIGF